MMRSPVVRAVGIVAFLCSPHMMTTTPLASTKTCHGSNHIEQQANDLQHEARRLWEQAVAAKGGRIRLYAIHSMLFSLSGNYTTTSATTNRVREEQLLVFPNKLWSFSDYRPDVFGLRMEMYNYDTNMHYVISPDDPHSLPKPIIDKQRNPSLLNAQLSYLLETKWLKPLPVRATKGKIGKLSVDIVQTDVNGERVDFALDQVTHLPLRVSRYNADDNKTAYTVNLSNYVELGGIKVPLRIEQNGADGNADKISMQINVDYDQDIFVKPPAIENGPDAWRLKPKTFDKLRHGL